VTKEYRDAQAKQQRGPVIPASDITSAVTDLGVSASDTLFVHAGMQGALRVEGATPAEKMDTVLAGFEACVPNGVLALPTFTYSFCRGESFDIDHSPSTVGGLTEHFRHKPDVRRTPEPIFSTAIRGEAPRAWEERLFAVGDKDCFGEDSVFAYLHAVDSKLLFFGVGFEYCTFIHRVEQYLGLPYRYMKDFSGDVVVQGSARPVTASYFVRDLESDVEDEFRPLARELEARGEARTMRLPKGPHLFVVGAQAVSEVAVEMVGRHPDFLLRRGHPVETLAG
jgi:aminoglycoside 3-N-acetyltransferase